MDSQENEIGHMCVGALSDDYWREIIAAVSASGSSTEITTDYLSVVAETVMQAARQISQCRGYLS